MNSRGARPRHGRSGCRQSDRDEVAPPPDEVGRVIQGECGAAPRRHLDGLAPRGKPGREHRPVIAEQRPQAGVEIGSTFVCGDADDAVA